jgi:putative hemolysin
MSTFKLIDLKQSISNPVIRGFSPFIERALAFDHMNEIYTDAVDRINGGNPADFFASILTRINVSYQVSPEDIARVPSSGLVLIVCNHPFGAIDGVIMGDLLTRCRPDFKLMVNHILYRIEAMRPWAICVNPFGGAEAKRQNFSGMKASIECLKSGGVLATWPSGTVSHLHLSQGAITDPEWSEHLAALARKTEATVLPVYFDGVNSPLFQMAGMIHPRVRTAMLAQEVMRKNGHEITVRVGQPIPFSKYKKLESDRNCIDFFRLKTYMLQNREVLPAGETESKPRWPVTLQIPLGKRKPSKALEAIVSPIDPVKMVEEIAALPIEAHLVSQGEFTVYAATADQIPFILREIGRCREITFRQVGEGTGRQIDLDAFDEYYTHLFMWNHTRQEIVGAYRIGCADEILKTRGVKGLYTSTLFHYRKSFHATLEHSLELGRSFICNQYQRKHVSLSLIWRGIGAYIARNPHYRTLFGPVSISNDYQSVSRDLIVQFLRQQKWDSELAACVKPRNPLRARRKTRISVLCLSHAFQDIDDVSAIVSELESDQKGIPILVKHYLRLNARMISFNLDKAFSHVIDGLVIVDMMKVDEPVLAKFMGAAELKEYRDYHLRAENA